MSNRQISPDNVQTVGLYRPNFNALAFPKHEKTIMLVTMNSYEMNSP